MPPKPVPNTYQHDNLIPNTNHRIDLGQGTKRFKRQHHCPRKEGGLHAISPRCLKQGHAGYCRSCGHLDDPRGTCRICGNKDYSVEPLSRASRFVRNKKVSMDDTLCQVDEEDHEWSKQQEKQAQECAKAEAKAKDEKAKKPSIVNDSEKQIDARTEETEQALQRQRSKTRRSRANRGGKGLVRRR